NLIEKALSELSEEVKDRRYWLWVLEGEVNRYRCAYARARDCYLRGEGIARERGDFRGVSMALEGQARIFLDTIQPREAERLVNRDRKSTRLNSSHVKISYAVFCLKKKKKKENNIYQ